MTELQEDLHVEGFFDAVILFDLAVAPHVFRYVGLVENVGEVEPLGFPVFDGFTRFEFVGASNHFVEGADAEFGHDFAHFLGDEVHEVDHMLRITSELGTQFGILCCDADRTGVHLADAHHDAADRDQRGGGKAKFFRSQKSSNDDIATSFKLTVGFDGDAAAQIIQQERLVGFGDTEFPRQACIFDGGLWGGARTAIVPTDQDHVCVTFRHTCRNRAHPNFGDELDVDACITVGVLQVEDELRQVFDRVDVVMGRGRNETHARGRETGFGDPRVDFATRKLTTFAGLGTLRHLDLQF